MEYLIVFLVVLIGAVIDDANNNSRKGFYKFECVVLIFFMGLRYKVGGDTLNYYSLFENLPTLPNLSKLDLDSQYSSGWIFFNAFCKSIYNDFCLVQIFQSAFVNFTFFHFFSKKSNYKFICVLFYYVLFYLMFNTEIMRAAISVSIFLWGHMYFEKNKKYLYFFLVIIAFLFHPESIVMLFFPLCRFLNRIKISLGSLVVIVFVSLIIATTYNIIPGIQSLISGYTLLEEKFVRYSEITYSINIFGYCLEVIKVSPFLFYLWVTRDSTNKNNNGYIILYIVLSIVAVNYSVLVSRVLDFLYPFVILVTTELFSEIRNSTISRKVVLSVCVSIIVFYNIQKYVKDEHWNLFYPYYSVFNPVDNINRYDLLRDFQTSN